MTDIGFYLVITFVFLGPWLARRFKAPNPLAWPIFLLAVSLILLHLLGLAHVYVPSEIGGPVTFILMTVVIVRLALDLFPSDRANRP